MSPRKTLESIGVASHKEFYQNKESKYEKQYSFIQSWANLYTPDNFSAINSDKQ